MSLRFSVRGIPVAQGSTRAFIRGGRAITVSKMHGGPLAGWRDAIATEARAAMGARPLIAGPARVVLAFTWPRPAGHSGKHGLRPSAPRWKTTAPDIDKTARAALDALTGVVFVDDRQVVGLVASKGWSETPGVEITVLELEVDRP